MKIHLTAVAVLMAASLVTARMAAPPAVQTRVASAELVFVGKVTGFGPKLIPAALEKGDTREMQVALVDVSDSLLGKVGKKVKVGFFPSGRKVFGLGLVSGSEAMFFVRKHPTMKDMYVAEMYGATVSEKDNESYKMQLTQVRQAAKLLADPVKSLKSKDADDRYLTAALLVMRYKTPRPGGKMEAVPAEESKLVLEALADADWSGKNPKFYYVAPLGIFGRLGATAKDGWTPPKDFTKFGSEASKWAKANADKFRIQRYAMPATGSSVEP